MAIVTDSKLPLHMYLTAPLGSVHVKFDNGLGLQQRYKTGLLRFPEVHCEMIKFPVFSRP